MDYTSLYYTIAGCSATLIGIVGGLVTAQVLYINNKSAENKSWLEKLEKEKEENKNRLEEIENDLDLKYVLDYIQNPDVIVDLINNEYPILTITKYADYFYIDENKLKEVWLKVTEIFENISSFYLNGENAVEINKDGIPIDIAIEYSSDSLDYFICKLICSKIDMFHMLPFENSKNISYLNDFELNKKKEEIEKITFKIEVINRDIEKYKKESYDFKNINMLKKGLYVLIIGTIVSVIYPLICSLIYYVCGISNEIILLSVIGLFILVIISMYYFIRKSIK